MYAKINLSKNIIRQRVPPLYEDDVMKFLRTYGDVKILSKKRKTTGSHSRIEFTPYGDEPRRFTVAGHNNKPISQKSLNDIIKKSGIPEEKWRNFRY